MTVKPEVLRFRCFRLRFTQSRDSSEAKPDKALSFSGSTGGLAEQKSSMISRKRCDCVGLSIFNFGVRILYRG